MVSSRPEMVCVIGSPSSSGGAGTRGRAAQFVDQVGGADGQQQHEHGNAGQIVGQRRWPAWRLRPEPDCELIASINQIRRGEVTGALGGAICLMKG